MQKMKESLAEGDIQGFLSSILSILSTQKKTAKPSITCSACGLSYDEFEHTGRLGCAQCYRDFSEQLKPLLQRIHGRVQHAGRMPAAATNGSSDQWSERMAELRRLMEEAVVSENFEDAAKYRDELRALNEIKEASAQ